MKVSELIKKLEDLPQDSDVLLAIDPEGNGFHKMRGAYPGLYDPEDVYEGALDPEWSAYDAGYDSEEEWEERKAEMTPCIVLWP